MGMINESVKDQSHNPVLDQIEAKIEEIVKPEDQSAFKRILVAGMKVMFDSKTHKMAMESVENAPDPMQGAVQGVADLMVLLAQESRGTMPPVPSVQASIVLLCQALGFLEQIGMVKIDNDNVSMAIKDLVEKLMERGGMTPEKLDQMIGQTEQTITSKMGG